jgi:hypothetical protein
VEENTCGGRRGVPTLSVRNEGEGRQRGLSNVTRKYKIQSRYKSERLVKAKKDVMPLLRFPQPFLLSIASANALRTDALEDQGAG